MGKVPSLKGKVALVTGANTGLGRETALELARAGATVYLACRNVEKGKEATRFIAQNLPEASVNVMELDLKSQVSVRSFVDQFLAKNVPLHILVNNAGATFSTPWYTDQGIGGCAQVNFLGPYTLTRLLERKLVQSAPSRVVNVSSLTHRLATMPSANKFLRDFRSGLYMEAKLANVLFSHELHRRWADKGVQVSAVDPGGVKSDIWRRSPNIVKWVVDSCFAPTSDGAEAIVFAANPPQDAPSPSAKQAAPLPPPPGMSENAKLYAKGFFAMPLLPRLSPTLMWLATPLAVIDYPIRNWTGGRVWGDVREVGSAPRSRNRQLAWDLWNEAADVAALSRD